MKDIVFKSEVIEVEDSLDAVYDWICDNGRGDGLPVVPPTPERVARMIAAAGRAADELVGMLAPRNAPAIVEKIAINAVMAGCRPDYFPVVLSAVAAMGDPSFNLHVVNTTTQSACLFLVINGPIRNELNVNCSYNCLGPGWRANATIGRAIRLIQLNIAGSIPGEISKSTQGQPGRYTMCIGEYEEKTPWEPLHVERGFKPQDSTVTVFGAAGTNDVVDAGDPQEKPESILGLIALSIEGQGSDRVVLGLLTPFTVIISPPQAQHMAAAGWSKNDVRQFLYDSVKDVPLSKWPEEKQEHMISRGLAVKGGTVSIIRSPEIIEVLVAGGLGGLHTVVFPSRTGITKLIPPVRQ